MSISGVYAIRNIRTGQVYVGSTVDLDNRRESHIAVLKLGRHHNPRLQCAWDADGPNAFTFELLEAVGPDSARLNDAEARWFAHFRSQGALLLADKHHRRALSNVPLALFPAPRLRELRLGRMLSIDSLSKDAGVARTSIMTLEHGGKARAETIRKLAAYFGISPQDLQRQPPEN